MIGMTNEAQNISDNIVNINDHVPASVGGLRGHIVRRITHISMMVIPFLYYWNGTNISNFFFELEPKQFVSIVAFIFVLIEIVRLRMGFVVFGQRDYESEQISAFFWGGFSVCLVLIISPEVGIQNSAFGFPLILGLTLIDPLMGELRRANWSTRNVIVIAYIGTISIWIFCHYILDTPLFIAPFIAAIVVASEWPRLTWIDDNATMLLIPLSFVLFLEPFL
ncbi:MAG: hypothetical protein ACJZ49_07110 [Candidatus Thalassarchaeaceae archaeon]|nr:MAG: hypothetical protein CMA04_001000 [Euryarchaeota archaeon]RPG76419.1 MAG: hypothetical protein CBC45_000800 [Euryarchaeota archaeon TMED85]|tara:strand:+ start:5361 stop:6026 length:666 start_codon:yes stop_codon:yes gene_type:complete